jgi:DNA-binding transcriptional LysR family regulator
MDLISLYYFNELCKDLNVTKTAARLFLSQQTLSNHIMRMEAEVKTQLFYRKPKLHLTDAGREMLIFVKNVLADKTLFDNHMADIEKEHWGLIRFGASRLCARSCLPIILPKFAQEYPQVSISLLETTSGQLQQQILDGELDMALSVISENSPILKSTIVMKDQVYLCIADSLLKKHYGKRTTRLKQKSIKGAHVSDFQELPFSIVSPPNILGITISKCFEEAGFAPKVYFSSSTTGITSAICSNGLSACFLSQLSIANSPDALTKAVNIFPLMYEGTFVYHKRYLVHHTKHYMTQYMLRFQELITDYFTSISEANLARVSKSK